MEFNVVIGLEMHVEMNTKSKMFSSAPVSYVAPSNTCLSLLDMSFPGTLPSVNKQAVVNAIRLSHALHMEISDILTFERKNYFYSDLPKGYQITQAFNPIGKNGYLTLNSGKIIRIERLHIEEDTCRQFHIGNESYLDFNRAGIPLLEIVTLPDITSGSEAKEVLETIRSMVTFLDISEGKAELGNLRCDVNVSLSEKGSNKLGHKVEIKNLNSLVNIQKAVDYEINRQSKLIKEGKSIKQETRRYDEAHKRTVELREKVDAVDYKFFTDPNIPPIKLSKEFIKDSIDSSLELASEKKARYKKLGLNDYDSSLLVSNKDISDYFDEGLKTGCSVKLLANWINGDIQAILNKENISIKEFNISSIELGNLISLVEQDKLSNKQAREILLEAHSSDKKIEKVLQERNFSLVNDEAKLLDIISELLDSNPQIVTDYKEGKDRVIGYLVGQVNKVTDGNANPKIVHKLIIQEIKRR